MNSTGVSGTGDRRATSLGLPLDLGEWIEPGQLLDWTVEEVGRLDWANPRLVEYLEKNPERHPRLLLILLTWAYATGVFESGEVAGACLRNSVLRSRCQGGPPSDREIERFRRDNRGLLKWSLAQLFKRVLRAKLNLPESYFPAGLSRYLDDGAVMRLDIARQMDRGASGF